MDCPECGGPLEAYVLGGREASVCERCGWVGIEADHRGTDGTEESWNEALGRFYEQQVEAARRRADLPPGAASVEEPSAGGSEGDPSAEREAEDPSADDGGNGEGRSRAAEMTEAGSERSGAAAGEDETAGEDEAASEATDDGDEAAADEDEAASETTDAGDEAAADEDEAASETTDAGEDEAADEDEAAAPVEKAERDDDGSSG